MLKKARSKTAFLSAFVFVLAAVSLNIFPSAVYAEPALFAGGDGSAGNPFLIEAAEQFDDMCALPGAETEMFYFKLIEGVYLEDDLFPAGTEGAFFDSRLFFEGSSFNVPSYIKSIENAVLIIPGKTYDATTDLKHEFIYLGNYDKDKAIELEFPDTPLTNSNVGFYGMEITFNANPEYQYHVYIAPGYEVRRAVLTVNVRNVARKGRRNPAFTYDIKGFVNGDNPEIYGGAESLSFDIKKLKRGTYPVESSVFSADNYKFEYVLTVVGLYPYEIGLIAASAAALFILFAAAAYLMLVKKKRLKDIFIREKTITVIKEVPMLNGQPLPEDEFTPREKEVAELLLQGFARREIAAKLFVSENTVKTHTQNIFDKCYVKSQKAFIAKYLIGGENNEARFKE